MNTQLQGNIDPAEVEKFEQVAATWWDKEGEFKPLHQINPLRLDFIRQHSQGLFDKVALDVGCGGGILAESMAKQGAVVTGIDAGQEPLNVAKLHALESGVTLDYQNVLAEPFAEQNPEKFDVVTCMEMLEHVPHPESVVASCAALAKQDGLVFFSTLNRNIKSWALAIVAAEYLLKWVPKGTHQHEKFIKPSELIGWMEACDLKPLAITGIHYNPISQSFYLSDDNVDVNYIVAARKL